MLDDAIRRHIQDRIEAFDRAYSRFRDDSIVAQMSRQAGEYEFPDDAVQLMDFYRALYDATNGRVTPLIGQALAQSGYDKEYSFRQKQVSAIPQWDDVMQWQGNVVTTRQPIVLDVGAAGKGYLVDIIGEILEMHGAAAYVIDASGDVRHRGNESDVVGLENPSDSSRVIGVMNLKNASLCASATNRRTWGSDMHHVFDPASASPTRDVAATWVMANDTMTADGLATALFFVDGDQLSKDWDFQYVRLMTDGKLSHSHEFMGELFI